jgi:eukaryotic-like serine/threonine-protein kinase
LAEVAITLGLLSAGTGNNQEAIEHFERALELDPVSSEAYRGMARAYEALGSKENIDKAEAVYLKAVQLRPDYWAGYSNLGRSYYRIGRKEEAANQFKDVTKLTPDNFAGFASLGAVYYHLQRFEEAQAMFERSLEIRPNLAAYTNLATLWFYQGKYAEAAGCMRRRWR